MTRNQVLIAGVFFVFVLLVLLALWKPQEKAAIQGSAPEIRPLMPEIGKYELAPSTQSAVELPDEGKPQNTVMAEPQKRTAKKVKPAEVEPEDPGYDSVNPGLVRQPPKLPPPEQLRQMQKQGIVAN